MDTSQCPTNMCEHTAEDHNPNAPYAGAVCCIKGCTCGQIILSAEDFDKLQEILSRPPKPNPRLEELFKRPRKLTDG